MQKLIVGILVCIFNTQPPISLHSLPIAIQYTADDELQTTDERTHFIGKYKDEIDALMGRTLESEDGIVYEADPASIFYYDQEGLCYAIKAPFSHFFKTDQNNSIPREKLMKALGLHIYEGKIFNFDWFSFNGFLFQLSKSEEGFFADTILFVQKDEPAELMSDEITVDK